MITDPISDMLTRIRNALMAGKSEVVFPFSKIKLTIAEILKREGFISEVITEGISSKKNIKVILKYKNNKPSIDSIRRISKPGRRIYFDTREIKQTMKGRGIFILSTSMGVMTNKEANKNNVGGEVLCEVY